MNSQRRGCIYGCGLALIFICLSVAKMGWAQDASQPTASMSSSSSSDTGEGKKIGDFQVTQSIEIGGRINDVTGSEAMYNTLENYQSGARLLEQSLTMRSLTHTDVFDTLTLSSFGYGGDPEQAARLRVDKYGWYTFSASHQHFQNYFDYDLFANPLNPPTGSPPVPINYSPHGYYNRQNLYNFDLVVLPMHKFSFRVDYNRNRFDGPAFSSYHAGTEALLNENTDNTLNGYRFGADFRPNKTTTISYTQLLQYYDGGTTYGLNPFNSWPLSNGRPVSFGLPWFNSGSPCSAPLTNGVANPNCNGFFAYNQFQDIDTYIPTEQLNVRSSSIKHLDLSGQFQYSRAHMTTPYDAFFSGLSTRSANLGFNTAGSSSSANWSSTSGDLSAVYHFTDKLRLLDTFRLRNFSVSGDYLDLEMSYFTALSAGTATLLTPIATFPGSNLLHTSSSPADIINELTANLLGQSTRSNDFQVQYDITQFFGVRAGFNWSNSNIQPGNTYAAALGDVYFPNTPNRGDCKNVPLNPDGSCTFAGVLTPFATSMTTTEINRYSGALGAWFRKGSNLHADVNAEYGGADNWIYRIDPLRSLNISGNVTYTPRQWLSLSGNLFFQKANNNAGDNAYHQHNYSAMFTATLTPNTHWGLDLAYNFDAIQQNMNICYEGDVVAPGSYTCIGDDSLLEVYNIYQTHTQYGYFAFTMTPIERVTLRLGYSIVDNQGSTTSLNTLLPLGPLDSTFQSPLGAIEVKLYKGVSFKGGWNYYQYGEGSFVGPTLPRYFHANNTTLALRYAF